MEVCEDHAVTAPRVSGGSVTVWSHRRNLSLSVAVQGAPSTRLLEPAAKLRGLRGTEGENEWRRTIGWETRGWIKDMGCFPCAVTQYRSSVLSLLCYKSGVPLHGQQKLILPQHSRDVPSCSRAGSRRQLSQSTLPLTARALRCCIAGSTKTWKSLNTVPKGKGQFVSEHYKQDSGRKRNTAATTAPGVVSQWRALIQICRGKPNSALLQGFAGWALPKLVRTNMPGPAPGHAGGERWGVRRHMGCLGQGQAYLHNARSTLVAHGQLLGIPNRWGHLCGGGLDAPKSRWFGGVSWGWKESASEHVRCVAVGSPPKQIVC